MGAGPASAAKAKPAESKKDSPARLDRAHPKQAGEASELSSALAWARQGFGTIGSPLPPERRSYFEGRFQADFSNVQLHTGPTAREAADALGAQAFTRNNHIVLGTPDTGADADFVLAHELAHVVQQSGSSASGFSSPRFGAAGDHLERGADSAASAAARPGPSPVRTAGRESAASIRLKPTKKASKPKTSKADKSTDDDGFSPYYVNPASATELAKTSVEEVKKWRERLKEQVQFVLIVVTDALYVYSDSGELKATYKLKARPPILGLYLGGGSGGILRAYINKDGVVKYKEIGGWDPVHKTEFKEWSEFTDAEQDKYFKPGVVPMTVIPGVPAADQTPPKDFVPEDAPSPDAGPTTKTDGTKGGKADSKEGLKLPPSGDEYKGLEHGKPANYPAFPASIRTGAGMVPVLGASELTMHLDWTYGEMNLIGAVWNASTLVKYGWERWDVTAIAAKGTAAKKDEAARRRQLAKDPDAKVEDQYSEHDLKQRARDIKEDAKNSAEAVGSLGNPNHSPLGRYNEVRTELGNLALVPTSTIVSMGGHLVDRVWHFLTKPDNEITLEWNKPGHYLIRCIASPREHEGRRYVPSVATTFVEARDAEFIARDTLGQADALIDELNVKLEKEKDPGRRKELEAQLKELQIGAHGSASEALRIAVAKKKKEVDNAVGRAKVRRKEELDALTKQLDFAVANEGKGMAGPDGKPKDAVRAEAAIASEVTGATYPLLLQLVPIEAGKRPRWALYDVTSKGDKLGYAYVGQGNDDGAAIADAFAAFRADNDYGRGTVVFHIPDSIPNVAKRDLSGRNVKRGDALARQRLHDLVAVLIALSLVIPGVGEAAMLLGGVLAAEHLIERWRNGNLEADASLVTDVIAILGALGSIGTRIANMVVVQSEKGFILALESGDQAAIKAALETMETASTAARAVRLANEIVGYGGLLWGNIETLNTIRKINEDEDEGRITHSAARSARAKAVLGAIQNHVLMFAGPLHEQAERKPEESSGRKGATEPETVKPRQQPEQTTPRAEPVPQEGAAPREAPRAPEPVRQPEKPATGAGAVRGKDTYELRTSGKGLRATDKGVSAQIEEAGSAKRLDRPTVGSAELTPVAGSPGNYTLELTVPGGSSVKVKVEVEMVSAFDPASQPHGGEEGPARMDLVRKGGTWEAKVKIHEMVREKDVSKLAGHEFDEIVDIVRKSNPGATDAEATAEARRQMTAEVFRPGAPSGKPLTGHDFAAARELMRAHQELAAAKDKTQKAMLKKRVEAMEKSMGLDDPVGGRERVAELEKLNYPPDLLHPLRARMESLRAAASTPPAPAVARELPADRIEHLLYPEPTSAGGFEKKGLGGGHDEAALQEFLKSNPKYRLTEVKKKVGPDGATYRAYEQEMQDSTGAWKKAMMGGDVLLKTTTDSPSKLLDDGLAAFDKWNAANATAPPPAWGGKTNGLWTGTSPSGVEFSGYASFDAGKYTIITIYPEGQWILK